MEAGPIAGPRAPIYSRGVPKLPTEILPCGLSAYAAADNFGGPAGSQRPAARARTPPRPAGAAAGGAAGGAAAATAEQGRCAHGDVHSLREEPLTELSTYSSCVIFRAGLVCGGSQSPRQAKT
ncbi:unnamed protein product [Prorocentrum cordatum]|uniref:Uncharacterized protein n=1 Tax=Prorocentrum cordatum TaxID=2364126 RepID=A0ABN9QNU8_9DINO|nr:unnamed protein product [Polarella glacialis]